jgi:hypothetical protein
MLRVAGACPALGCRETLGSSDDRASVGLVTIDEQALALPQGMMGRAKAHYDGIVALSQTDFTEDPKEIAVPVLVMRSAA